MKVIGVVSALVVAGATFSVNTSSAFAQESYDEGRFRTVIIKRSVGDGTENIRYGTLMIDSKTGRTWILDEQQGRWVPVGYREPGTNIILQPGN
ncbi:MULTISPECIES: hypothetical protein [Thalassospira]|uniref:Uncharacterized protein n=2 Tax=Thalassospira TaxID=168934 RepID=A0A367W382_9PROT|nr:MULTISPECIES: hypothetical protein [Thalassospira]MDG4720909.1 hypothetical protein [Thalassospira sp. FZY0004]RCK34898.1 hypothetical protein TH19_14330 [Thalassospira profundimaris]